MRFGFGFTVLIAILVATLVGFIEYAASRRLRPPIRYWAVAIAYLGVVGVSLAVDAGLGVVMAILAFWSFAVPRLWAKFWPSFYFGFLFCFVVFALLSPVWPLLVIPDHITDAVWRIGFPFFFAGEIGWGISGWFFDAEVFAVDLTIAVAFSLAVGFAGHRVRKAHIFEVDGARI